jgi:hypothetical protein
VSKAKTNRRVAKATATVPTRTAPKASTEKHVHTWPRTLVKRRGSKVRDVCPCGHNDPWRSMTESEKTFYGIAKAFGVPPQMLGDVAVNTSAETDGENWVTIGDDAMRDLIGGDSIERVTRDFFTRTETMIDISTTSEPKDAEPDANCYTLPDGNCVSDKECMHTSESKENVVDPEDKFSKVRALLGKTADTAHKAVTDKAHQTAAEAGVDVSGTKSLPGKSLPKRLPQSVAEHNRKHQINPYDDSPADRRIIGSTGALKTLINDTLDDDLKDRRDHSDSVVLEDYDADFNLEDWSDQPYTSNRRADVCYLLLRENDGGYVWKYLLPRKRAHAELKTFMEKNPNGAHAIGDAQWLYSVGEWWFPEDAQNFVTKHGGTFSDIGGIPEADADRDMVWMVVGDDYIELLDREDADTEILRAVREGKTVKTGDADFNTETGDWEISEAVLIQHGFAKNVGDTGYHKATVQDVAKEMSRTLDLIDQVVEARLTDEVLDAKRKQIKDNAYGSDMHTITFPYALPEPFEATFGPDTRDGLIARLMKNGHTREQLVYAVETLGFMVIGSNRQPNMTAIVTAIVDGQIAAKQEETPEEQAKNPDRFYIELGTGDDRKTVYSLPEHAVSQLTDILGHWKRDDLEFALRKLGVNGVTTKTVKANLIRAVVCMADTTLNLEHRKNRAAIMASTKPLVTADEEWAKHYGDFSN